MWDSSRKKVFIRTDANKVIASGHVMRCLSKLMLFSISDCRLNS